MERSRKLNFVELVDVKKTFITEDDISNKVLDSISLKVMENEFLVVLGPGQSGKTTLMKIITGLETRTAGEVKLNGKIIDGPTPEIGMVYQTPHLYPWLTTFSNIAYGPKVRGVDKSEYTKTVNEYIKLVGLQGFEKAYPNKLSGGMKQRVGIARAYANNPDLLIMDDPFSALDAQTRYLMQDELVNIWQKDKKTIIFVTNNVEEAIYLADRVVVLSNTPTIIKNEYIIDLPRPRDYVSDKFLEIRTLISDSLDNTR